MISARALGVYTYLRITDASISAENLAKVFKEGREAMSAALKELVQYKMITCKRERIGNRIMTVNRLVDPAFWAPETRLLIPLYMQNSNLILNDYSFIHKKIVIGGANEEESAQVDRDWWGFNSYEQDPEEIAELKRKAKERRQKEYEELRAAKTEARITSLRNLEPINWTVDNGVYYFAQRMIRWDIPPWETARTRFLAAYAKARKEFGTNGVTEQKMIDRFFQTLDHEKNLRDPEKIWRAFISRFGSILHDVELAEIDMDKQQEIARKSLESF